MSNNLSLNFVEMETNELERWEKHDVFHRSMDIRRDATPYVFYEGPPTANGKPGLHHVWARTFKDLFCRYKTMQGHFVERRAGWDTHGLPVEVEVEKKLGLKNKKDIETYGIDKFVAECKNSVLQYVDDWRKLTSRMAFWVDFDDAYWTFDPNYVQSLWWQLRQMWDKGLLYEDLKGVPYCTRCGTPLSSHELGQPGVYQTTTDLSVYAAFPLHGEFADKSLVAWTTTPWTLSSNTGLAINSALQYVEVDGLIMAKSRAEAVLGEKAAGAKPFDIKQLVGLSYTRPVEDIVLSTPPKIIDDEFVSEGDGTGVVHLAPAFGEIDREVGKANGLAVANPMSTTGHFDSSIPWLSGVFYEEATKLIIEKLKTDGTLVKEEMYTHEYPHCWRCGTRLIYWGKQSWYIATSKFREKMLAENETINWNPDTVKHGRFGEWLDHNVDWALSRDRYWGTPLPVWRCGKNHTYCIESLEELGQLTGRDLKNIDPHRPSIDSVTFPCKECDETMTRETAVIDVWFDSGGMPAAQFGYPHVEGSKERFAFPADYIAEAIDQTRGWFYSLLAINTLVFGSTPYKNVLCLGLLVDEDGKKMSKTVGNVVDPWDVMNTLGSDACRWWMLSQGSPWTTTRFSMDTVRAVANETLVTLWNSWKFFDSYRADFVNGSVAAPDKTERPLLDKWVLSRLNETVKQVTDHLDNYRTLEAANALKTMVDDTSNWYIRLSRRRFWNTDSNGVASDYASACATLQEVLSTLALLFAPMTPYESDLLWREVNQRADDDSVHLADWPKADDSLIDSDLNEKMALSRLAASLGRTARSKSSVKVRQPLSRALVMLPQGEGQFIEQLVADELNVDHVEAVTGLHEFAKYEVSPLFPSLGPKLGENAKELRKWLETQDSDAIAQTLLNDNTVKANIGDGTYELTSDDFQVRMVDLPGYAVAQENGVAVVLDLNLDDTLIARGLAREAIRSIQDLRKSSGFDVSDRISLNIEGAPELDPYIDDIATEVLATSVAREPGMGEGQIIELDESRHVTVWVAKV